MSDSVTLRAADGHSFGAYVARPATEPIAGLIVVQEIFGINAHIRSVADDWARDGFLAVAPALFDRISPGIELGYDPAGMQTAMSLFPKIRCRQIDPRRRRGHRLCRRRYPQESRRHRLLPRRHHRLALRHAPSPAAAVGYYGGRIGNYAGEKPTCPVMLHFGRQDTHIPAAEVEKVHSAHPEVEIFWYDAGHAFNCDPRPSYNAAAAKEARQRSLEFLKKHLA